MNKKAQSLSEYALILGVVSLALLAMQPYFKRGIQGIAKATLDDLSAPAEEDYKNIAGKAASAQKLGVISRGLVMHNSKKPLTTKAEKEIKVKDYAAVNNTLSRQTTIIKDTTESSGKWSTTTASYNPVKELTQEENSPSPSTGNKPGQTKGP
jgi:hypothetical protein